ncbi:hypothetical protein B296_00024394 [Ensete ventricosum]|uniref:Uncharacterized protein n=1 Tax=Ensete ventricosum TaxID=4639 RepID=A0A427AV07_ENSVE|nr:hypothetical protein B296_00024394 [Ensete ventricosum]
MACCRHAWSGAPPWPPESLDSSSSHSTLWIHSSPQSHPQRQQHSQLLFSMERCSEDRQSLIPPSCHFKALSLFRRFGLRGGVASVLSPRRSMSFVLTQLVAPCVTQDGGELSRLECYR